MAKPIEQGTKLYIATAVNCGEEDGGEVEILGVFSTKAKAKKAILLDVEMHSEEWQEASDGDAWCDNDGDTTVLNSGDDRYVRRYTIETCKFGG